MVVSMAVPAFAADYDYEDYSFLLLLTVDETKIAKGDTVTVRLTVFGEYPDGTSIDEFDFYSFYDEITFNDNRFAYVPDSAETEYGFELDDSKADDGLLELSCDDVEEIQNGTTILAFELEALKSSGYAELAQDDYEIYYGRYGEYIDVYDDCMDVKASTSSSSADGYSIDTKYDEDCGAVYISQSSAEEDEEVWFRIVTYSGHEVDDIEVLNSDDDEISYDWDYDESGYKYYYFDMPDDDVTIEVTFDDDGSSSGKEYSVSLDYEADYGFARLNYTSAEKGDKVRIYVEPNDDNYTIDITVEDSDGDSVEVDESTKYYYFTMPADDVEVYVDFDGEDTSTATKYSIDYSFDDDYGTVTGPSKAAEDTEVKFYIYPEDDYEVDTVVVRDFDGDKVTSAKEDSDGYWYFKMPDEKVYVDIEFDEEGTSSSGKSYAIELGCDEDYGSISAASKAEKGDKVKVYLYPDDGYKVDDIEITEDKTGDDVTIYGDADDDYIYFYMPGDSVYIYVDFVRGGSSSSSTKYDINLDYDEDYGTVDISRSTSTKGRTITIYPDPDSGYVVDDVTVTRTSKSTTTVKVTEDEDDDGETYYYFTMPSYDVDVEVTFVRKGSSTGAYKVSVNSSIKNGTVETSDTKADSGDKVDIFVEPADGYEVDTVTVTRDSNSVKVTVTENKDGSYTFTMPSTRVTVNATFKKVTKTTYDITIDSAIKNGTVAASAAKSASGEKITLTVTPAKNYDVNSVTVTKGTSKTAVSVTKNSNGTYSFTMPAEKVTVSAAFKANTTPGAHVCAAKPFTDVDVSANSWYHAAVDYVISNGLMNGTSTTTFEPGTETSRGMIVTVLWRLAGKPLSDATIPYTDVPAGEWYTEAIRWAAANGILNDIATTGAFEPNSSLTREQFAAIFYRYVQYNGGGYKGIISANLSKFNDMSEISYWAVEALSWCNENGILNGDNTTGKLMPKGNVDRAQFAQILMNYSNLEK